MISFGSCIYPTATLGSVKVSPSRVASPENYNHQTLKVSGVTPRPELPPITLCKSFMQEQEELNTRSRNTMTMKHQGADASGGLCITAALL